MNIHAEITPGNYCDRFFQWNRDCSQNC